MARVVFKGHDGRRVQQLEDEGHTLKEAIRISAEETVERWGGEIMRRKHSTFGIVFLLRCSFVALVAVSQQKTIGQLVVLLR